TSTSITSACSRCPSRSAPPPITSQSWQPSPSTKPRFGVSERTVRAPRDAKTRVAHPVVTFDGLPYDLGEDHARATPTGKYAVRGVQPATGTRGEDQQRGAPSSNAGRFHRGPRTQRVPRRRGNADLAAGRHGRVPRGTRSLRR